MRIGLVGTRLVGVDGVSFESLKWEEVLVGLGHEIRLCAAEVPADRPGGRLITAMHFLDPDARAVSSAAFDPAADADAVRREVDRQADALLPQLADWVEREAIDLLVVENAWAIPMHLPLGVALARLVGELRLPAIGHHHDYAWERDRFAFCGVPEVLESAFPPDLPNVRHVSISSLAAAELERRRGIHSVVIPNAYPFEIPPPGRDDYSRSLRSELGMGTHNLVVVQPTRVVPRKGIELAIELVQRLNDPRAHLLITSPAGDEGLEYLARLHVLADRLGVDLRYAAERFAHQRLQRGPQRTYAVTDAYLEADLISFPSLHEGFGNALVEAVYFAKPLVVNRYTVYEADIRPLGFRFVEISGAITDRTVTEVHQLIRDEQRRADDAAHNFAIGLRHLGFAMLRERLAAVLASV
ncbi:MAG TPA: glycosyltransferase family 4 protein [Candidatus Limnocylindria bacterium]|nr:glycosyltransferase family 4 protein [Candidatus Limnocylindria bacterium]